MSTTNLSELSYRELQAVCQENNLAATGKKAELLERLEEHFNDSDADKDEGEQNGEDDDIEAEEENEDAEGDEEEDEDDVEYEDGDIIGVLMRIDGDDAVVLADDFAEMFDKDNDEAEEANDEDDDIGTAADIFSSIVSHSALGLEVLVFLYNLFLLNAQLNKDTHPHSGAEVIEGAGGFSEVFPVLVGKMQEFSTWANLAGYAVFMIAFPTFVGMLMGKHGSPDSVFGFAVSRYVLYYLASSLTSFVFFTHINFISVRTFNVTCGVSLAAAFWQRTQF